MTPHMDGAVLVVLDAPSATLIGIDLKEWQIGPKFGGITAIPSGLHLLHWKAVSPRSNEVGSPACCLLWLPSASIHPLQWNSECEMLERWEAASTTTEDQLQRLRQSVRGGEILDRLGNYEDAIVSSSTHIRTTWRHLSAPLQSERCWEYLKALVSNRPEDAVGANGWYLPLASSPDHPSSFLPFFYRDESNEGKHHFYEDDAHLRVLSPADRTSRFLDASYRLEFAGQMLAIDLEEFRERFLWEMSLSYILFLNVSFLYGLERWKDCVHAFCSAQKWLTSDNMADITFNIKVTELLTYQLASFPADFFVDTLLSSSFLAADLQVCAMELFRGASLLPILWHCSLVLLSY